jgi:hypothetical protein
VRCFQEKHFYPWKIFLNEIEPHCNRDNTTWGTVLLKIFTNLKPFSEHNFALCLCFMRYCCV